MSYAISDIITWAKASQCLAAINERKNLAFRQGTIEENLDVKLYVERRSLEYAYAQDPTSDQTFQIAQGVLALCGIYLFKAQTATGSGGGISPVTPGGGSPEQLNFKVAASGTTLIDGQSSVTLPAEWAGFNIVVVRNGTPLTQIPSAPIYYTWNSTTKELVVVPAAFLDDEFQITATV